MFGIEAENKELNRRRLLKLTLGGSAALVAGCMPGAQVPGSGGSRPVSTTITSAPVTINVLVSTPDVSAFQAFGALFRAKYPNVTVNVTGQDFSTLTTTVPHVISGTNVPDLVRLASFGNLVRNRLLTSLDGYATAYGWNTWPQSQFSSTRVADDGRERGTGALYGAGPGFSVTGVFYNKALAKQVGMTEPPSTLDEFERLLGSAKAAGLVPIMINGKDGGLALPLQNLQMNYAGTTQVVQDWNYSKPGANINTPAMVRAATTLQQWAKRGYLPADVNGIDQAQAPAEFLAGKAVFFPNGNWQAPGLDKKPGAFGFFLFPPSKAGDRFAAMTAVELLAIPAKSANPDVAAAFLEFVQTDTQARQKALDVGGMVPAGPSDAAKPNTSPGSVVATTVDAFETLLRNDGLVDFMANATASIYANSLIPQTQLLVAGAVSPSEFAAKIQADYEHEIG